MALTMEDAQETIEDVFDFDHVGAEMSALRSNLDSQTAKEDLTSALAKFAVEECEDGSEDAVELLKRAATARVEQFINGARYSQSGCSKL